MSDRHSPDFDRGANSGPANSGTMEPAARSDVSMLAGLRRKDRQTLSMVVQQYNSILTKAAWLYLADVHAAEDAVQDTFIAAWDAARRTTDSTSLKSWLMGILMNRCRKHIRDAVRRRRRDKQAALNKGNSAPDDTAAADALDEKLQALQHALSSLTPRHREIVILRYYQGMSVEQAGTALGVPAGTIKSRSNAAIAELRKIITNKETLP